MNIKITEELCRAVGVAKMRDYGVDEDSFKWQRYEEIDLSEFGLLRLSRLHDLIEPHARMRGAKVLLGDIERWLLVMSGAGEAKPRSVEQFRTMLHQILLRAPGHRLYERNDARGVWCAYYVNEVRYVPPRLERSYSSAAHVTAELIWVEMGGRRSRLITWDAENCLHRVPSESLARMNLITETDDLRAAYLASVARFGDLVGNIGTQLLARGVGTDDLDGNEKERTGWWWRRVNQIRLDRDGDPARVVVDVFHESDKDEDHEREPSINPTTWLRSQERSTPKDKRKELPREDEVEDPSLAAPEIPLHPNLACFDMRRHTRLRIHVDQVEEYRYNPALGEKLVLPHDARALVEMLLANKGEFRDIVAGKGGGAIILCAGRPGTGKTLTAEVYAEVTQRPLYSVQTSQLGTEPDDLEDELLKVFARSQRWGAILLLDEADVYVAARGNSLEQNAIVGVFLRVLEYYQGVLFLTTNRADLVDDAVASRCVARIDYRIPTPEDQARIWSILAQTAGLDVAPAVIAEVVQRHPALSGRDIKNLLKLAKLVSSSRGVPIDADMIGFVKQFKPTASDVADHASDGTSADRTTAGLALSGVDAPDFDKRGRRGS